jgi:hypothetical protein
MSQGSPTISNVGGGPSIMVIFSCSDMDNFDVQFDVAAESYHIFIRQDAQRYIPLLAFTIAVLYLIFAETGNFVG